MQGKEDISENRSRVTFFETENNSNQLKYYIYWFEILFKSIENKKYCIFWQSKTEKLYMLAFAIYPYSGWGAKRSPCQFSPVISAKVGIRNFSFNPFGTLPNYWTWTNTTLQKNDFFWSNPSKIEVMITFLIETSELPNFGHMATSTI